MTISVTGPDGSNFSFPDGMSEADISSAMEGHYGSTKDVNPLVDLAKAAPVGVAQGVIGLPGMGGDLQQLAKAGVDKVAEKTGLSAADPLGWLAGKFEEHFPNAAKFIKESNAKSANAPIRQISSGDMPGEIKLPTSSGIQGQVEKVTGPFYQAQTPLGKIGQKAGQVLPALATGGGSVAGLAGKAIGAGLGAEGAGQAADALKGYLPDAAAPYAEPVARAIGTGVGVFGPSAIRRAITPLPMQADQAAAVAALRATNPDLVNATTAGQLTESPRLMSLEARAPRTAAVPEKQAQAYTQGVMRQAGSPGLFNDAGLAEAKKVGDELDTLRNAHRMSPSEFTSLNKAVDQERADLFKKVGTSEPFDRIRDEIRNGPTGGNPKPLDMTGGRYGALRQMLRGAESGAPNTYEQTAIANVRGRLNQAFQNSMPAADAEKLRQLDRQYSNYKILDSIKQKPGENTLTPQQVFGKALKGSDLREQADQASRLMVQHQKPPPTEGDLAKVLTSLAGGAFGAGSGYATGGPLSAVSEGLVGMIAGEKIPPAFNLLRNVTGRAVARPTVQKYLKNQLYLPGPNSSADRSTLLRLLMSPPVEQPVGQAQ